MSHPFGDLISQHLHRKHGLSQSKLAAGILQAPTIITKMCKGQRLTGPHARERVVAIIGWLHRQGALGTLAEANAVLDAAGMSALNERAPAEAALLADFLPVEGVHPSSAPWVALPIEFDVAAPLIGRQAEWAQLQAAWQRAGAGGANFALISGEAGIGKSRLAEELLLQVSRGGFAAVRTRAYAAEGRLSYAPVIEWLRGDAIRQSLSRLDGVWLSEVARVLPELLAQRADLVPPPPLSDFAQRQRFFEALARAMLAAPQPLLLVMDDLQWCDQDTLEWLHYLLHFDPRARVLVVGTARAEELSATPPLINLLLALRKDGQATEIVLQPLDAAESAKLANAVVGRDLDVNEAMRLFHETEGNPLFVVEMARAGRAGDATDLTSHRDQSGLRLPPRVHAVIAGRLARLTPAARTVAQVAATIGRQFTFDVLIRASEGDEDDVASGLDELWQRGIVRDQAHNSYDFSHDKIRDVAYAEISPMKRRHWHGRVAQALQAIYAHGLDSVSAQLAAHYEQAGMVAQAIAFYQRAAGVAQRIYANEEAIQLINRGLASLHTAPEDLRRDEQELALVTALGVPLVALKGYGAPEVLAALSQAQALSQQLGKPPDPATLRALAIAHLAHANFDRGFTLGEQLLQLAEQLEDPTLTVEGHYVLGVSLFYVGAFEASRRHLDQAVAHYDPELSHIHTARYAQDPRVICLCRQAIDLWCLGYPDQASKMWRESLAYARRLSHPFTLAYTLSWTALLHCIAGERDLARELAEEGMAVGRQHRLGQWLAESTALHGWAVAAGSEGEAGLAEMERGTSLFGSDGTVFLMPYFFGRLAEQYARLDQVERALTVLDDALATAEHHGERWCESELHRLRGEVLLRSGADEPEIEAAFQRAIGVAQAQQAKSLELRAALSLARLWQTRGEAAEACDVLAPIYGWFTEGQDTADLTEARTLIERLRGER